MGQLRPPFKRPLLYTRSSRVSKAGHLDEGTDGRADGRPYRSESAALTSAGTSTRSKLDI